MTEQEALERIKSARERELEAECARLLALVRGAVGIVSLPVSSDTPNRWSRWLGSARCALIDAESSARRVLAQGGAS